ncbi:retrotransposon protein, putative, ty1-copia subclass [Tanacetum coccineum]
MNGVAERRNRTLLDMVRSMMCRATLPISLWGYALETAAHILNLVPTKKVSKIPFEMWKGKRPLLGTSKYEEESFGYLFYKPKDNVVFVARRGVFLKREIISKEDGGEDKISDSTLTKINKPANYKEAMASLEAAKWKEAMKNEIQSMYDKSLEFG